MTNEDKSKTWYSWLSRFNPLSKQKEEDDLDTLVQKMFYLSEDVIQRKRVVRRLSKKTGHSKEDLWKARNSVENILDGKRREMLLPIADALRYVNTDFADNYDISELLSSCANVDFEMTPERMGEFALRTLNTKYCRSNGYEDFYDYLSFRYDCSEVKTTSGIVKRFKIYLDTPVSVALMHCGEPKALVSVLPISRETMMIYQLQGVRPEIKEKRQNWRSTHGGGILGRFDWKQVMVGCAEQVATDLGYTEMAIQRARNNQWVRCGAPDFAKRAEVIYDATAERLGYAQREEGNWYKRITKSL